GRCCRRPPRRGLARPGRRRSATPLRRVHDPSSPACLPPCRRPRAGYHPDRPRPASAPRRKGHVARAGFVPPTAVFPPDRRPEDDLALFGRRRGEGTSVLVEGQTPNLVRVPPEAESILAGGCFPEADPQPGADGQSLPVGREREAIEAVGERP